MILLSILLLSNEVVASSTVVDVSWPNCRAAHAAKYQFGIVGVTGGLDFRPNPCLLQEISWFSRYELYMNTGYPGDNYARKFQHEPRWCRITDSHCLSYNYGYQAAGYALRYAAQQNIHAARWWLDVETVNSWSLLPATNRATLQGAIAAVRQQAFPAQVGLYAYPGQWNELTATWHNGLPAWVATGQTSRAPALAACRSATFTGGPAILSQYTVRLDENVICQ